MPTLSPPLMSHGMYRDLVLTAFSDSVWRSLAGLPELGMLPAEVFSELDGTIRTMAFGRMVAVDGPGDGERLVRFVGQGGFEGFQVDLAGALVVRLEGRLGRRNYLELITRVIPGALAENLAAQAGADGTTRYETYRLRVPGPRPGIAALVASRVN